MPATRDIFAEAAERVARIRARVRDLDAEGLPLYEFAGPRGTKIVVHAATRKPGTWQITRFDADGEPVGHVESASRTAALTDAAKWYGADLGDGPMRLPRRR